MINVKEIVQLENRKYGELNDMANEILDESLLSLLDKHQNGTKTEQLSAFSALVKRYPEYKTFCYPETFLRENELFICEENCAFIRRSAFYDLVSNYDDIREFCDINPEKIDTALVFVDWQTKRKTQPDKETIAEIRNSFLYFIDYMNDLKIEIAKNRQN